MKRSLFFILLILNYASAQVAQRPQHDPPEVVNEYTEVISIDICKNEITVTDGSAYKVGDTILLIQMKGAIIDTSNTSSFGTVIDYKNAGNYEFNYISQKSGNVVTFKNALTKSYDIPTGVVQLIRVPYFKDPVFNGGLTCMPWDGTKGGVLAIISRNGLTCSEDIDVTGMGFRGGDGYNAVLPSSNCNANGWIYPSASQLAAFKGESIATLSQNIIKGKGSPAGGGGGGLSHNSGGGGGGNAGTGGFGGYQSDTCSSILFDNRGIGGKNLQYNTSANKIFMGSGGGAGHIDNASFLPPNGGNGGGIIILITDNLVMTGKKIMSNGRDGDACVNMDCSDGMGGGGAGGTILININTTDATTFETLGGNGADVTGTITPGGKVGPGGGGGGGAFFINQSSLPVSTTLVNNPGSNGVLTMNAGNSWGATAGTNGLNFFNLVLPIDAILFKPNIDSVRIKDSVMSCNRLDFKGQAFTNTNPITAWSWDFGDGATANTQNTVHDYGTVGSYTVKLIVTDSNGCRDSIAKSVTTAGTMYADGGADTSLCSSGQVSIKLNGSGGSTYSWSPALYLNNSTSQNPIATITTTTKFYVTVSNGTGCSAIDSVTITLKPKPVVKTLNDTSICKNATLLLTTTGASTYTWMPANYVSNPAIASPRFTDSVSRTLIVRGAIANGCFADDTININVKTPTILLAPPDKSFCFKSSVQLDGGNGNTFSYNWSPSLYLNNASIVNPIANPPSSLNYTVKISDKVCNYDSSFIVKVTVLPLPVLSASKTNDINCNLPFAHLNASGAVQYVWSPALFLNNNGVANPIANPTNTTTYFVTGTSTNGCQNSDSVTLVVSFGNNGFELPNSFTPNDDGKNDCFGIRYYRNVQNLKFIIYNRYGEKVFETINAAECWDGYYRGKQAAQGNYIYYLNAKTLCGEVIKRGSILLIR